MVKTFKRKSALAAVFPAFDALEKRLMFSHDGYDDLSDDHLHSGPSISTFPAIEANAVKTDAYSGGSNNDGGPAAASPLSAIPILHTNPSAAAKLFIDFDGAPAQFWGAYQTTAAPAYDQDGDPYSFSDAEINSMREIVARVGEKYSPFNLDVTTADPGLYTPNTLRIVVGGNGGWFGGGGGVSYISSFYSTSTATSFVFSANLGNGYAAYTAEAICHESGHAFGLGHQSAFNGSGQKIDEYYSGDGNRAPAMGNSYGATRGMWWYGTSYSASYMQDDLAIISGSRNGFGYRTDDYANTLNLATPLSVSGLNISGGGIITTTGDGDTFSFTTGAGTVTLNAAVFASGATLDLKLQLFDASGTLLATADTGNLGESITMSLAAGAYNIAVASHGGYGDVGQYTISGTVSSAAVITVTAPSGLSSSVSNNLVSLGWTGNDATAGSYLIQRSTDGGQNWSTLATISSASSTYTDSAVSTGSTYSYRVFAVAGSIQSSASNTTTVTVPVPPPPTVSPPSGLNSSVANNVISLSWTGTDATATGYLIQRSTDGGQNWSNLATISSAGSNYVDSSVSPGSSYTYRVFALAGNTESTASNVTTAVVPLPPPATVSAPSGLNSSVANNVVSLSWTGTDATATGYLIQRSTDGGQNWSNLATISSAGSNYADSSVSPGSSYTYRVFALAGNTESTASNTTTALVPVPPPIPATPTNLTAWRRVNGRVGLTWTDNANNEDGFYVEYSTDGGAWLVLGKVRRNMTAVDVSGLSSSRSYAFRVRAFIIAGQTSQYTVAASLASGATVSTRAGQVAHATKPKPHKVPIKRHLKARAGHKGN